MKRVIFAVLFLALCSVAVAEASDRCGRNTTRYYDNSGSNCSQNYGRQPAYFTEYMQNRYVPRQSYYTDYTRQQRNCGSSSSYYSVPTTTVCSPVVSYSYQPTTVCQQPQRVVYYKRVHGRHHRTWTIIVEVR